MRNRRLSRRSLVTAITLIVLLVAVAGAEAYRIIACSGGTWIVYFYSPDGQYQGYMSGSGDCPGA